jgi:hypothetical protein
MANEVYANGREISCKSGDGKVIATFPDVCFTPPENPATPPGMPVPYLISSFSSETTEGTKNVKINGKEVMLRNISYYSKCIGDESGVAAKKGMITSSNVSKTLFKSWSMDVKFEGQNVVRHLDLTTSNHRSDPGNASIPWTNVEKQSVDGNSCKAIVQKIHPYGNANCKTGSQSHHIIDNASLTMEGARKIPLENIVSKAVGRAKRNLFQPGSQHPGRKYDENAAPCICLTGSKSDKTTQHGRAHETTKEKANALSSDSGKWTYQDARSAGTKSIQDALKLKDWEAECIGLALDAYYKSKLNFDNKTEIVAPTGRKCSATHFDNGGGTACRAFELR